MFFRLANRWLAMISMSSMVAKIGRVLIEGRVNIIALEQICVACCMFDRRHLTIFVFVCDYYYDIVGREKKTQLVSVMLNS